MGAAPRCLPLHVGAPLCRRPCFFFLLFQLPLLLTYQRSIGHIRYSLHDLLPLFFCLIVAVFVIDLYVCVPDHEFFYQSYRPLAIFYVLPVVHLSPFVILFLYRPLAGPSNLREFNPSGYEESADFALRTFKATYDLLIKSGEPLFDSFSPNT